MFEYNRDNFVKEAQRSFELYGFRNIKASDINVLVDNDFVSLSYSAYGFVFSVSYVGDNSAERFSSSVEHNSVSFVRDYDIDKLEASGEDIYSCILNYEGYYGSKLVSEFKEDYKDLAGYETFNQCLADILLSLLGYADK